ncbi:uncharacterized protein EV420DRAFT_1744868 [Desarmillaria tabescens]|uniref:Uncharacterized protein n=1 Tax=Armillaria tabescens TaxID=1929756 RepID=A0AA39NF54_ARMTA|nr:uncharacterized protein EV420DRAFT_1744868 [Desarmillaria tabescens]KAK0464512.1 hypothetical protein EV420DRAFT_1744868 [Desarmillaria tabescens]
MKINVSTLCRQRKTQHILQILVFLFTVVAILGGMRSNPVYVTVFGILAALVAFLAVLLGQVKHKKEVINKWDFSVTCRAQGRSSSRSLSKATSFSLVTRSPTNARGRVGKSRKEGAKLRDGSFSAGQNSDRSRRIFVLEWGTEGCGKAKSEDYEKERKDGILDEEEKE